MMTQTTDDTEPIHTSTRVPPAERAERAYRPDTDSAAAAPDDEPISVTRIPSTEGRFG